MVPITFEIGFFLATIELSSITLVVKMRSIPNKKFVANLINIQLAQTAI